MAISSFGEAFVMLDENHNVLNNFILYADDRCHGIDKWFIEKYGGKRIFDITGVYPNQSFSLMKLIWFQQNRSDLFSKVNYLFFADDYFNFLICGQGGVDYGTASKSLMFDVHKKDWSDELLKIGQVKREWLSSINPIGKKIGVIKKELANELGLSDQIVIYQGTHDQCNATLGGGILESGSALMGEGSTESINIVVSDEIFNHSDYLSNNKLCVEPYVEPNLYMVPCSFLTYGNAVKWFTKNFGAVSLAKKGADETIFDYFEKAAANKTTLMFFPHLSAVNLMEPGCNVKGSIVGLEMNTPCEDIYRALQQGLNFETRINLERVDKLGIKIDELVTTGGLTRSTCFVQMKSDILKQNIRVLTQPEAGLLGLAIIVSVSEHEYSSYKDAIKNMVRYGKIYKPIDDYEDLYCAYCQQRERMMI